MFFWRFRLYFYLQFSSANFIFKHISSFYVLTYFMLLVSSYTPWKHQNTFGVLMFSGGKERDNGHEMGNVAGKHTYSVKTKNTKLVC